VTLALPTARRFCPRLNMGNPPEGLSTTRVSVCSSSSRLSGSPVEWASVLHIQRFMETLVLTAAMTLSGLLAIGSTRAVLGVLLFALTRDAAGR
jgi:hypothetical protein